LGREGGSREGLELKGHQIDNRHYITILAPLRVGRGINIPVFQIIGVGFGQKFNAEFSTWIDAIGPELIPAEDLIG
jgi:hypothetical protein